MNSETILEIDFYSSLLNMARVKTVKRSEVGANTVWNYKRNDDGFTLVEVIVSLALFTVMSGAVLTTLLAAINLTRDDKSRLEAVSLATREIEITQDAFTSGTRGPSAIILNQVINASPLPGANSGDPLLVDGVPYTVVRDTQWAPVNDVSAAASTSTCNDPTTTELAYLKVHVEVSWPSLSGRRPVTLDTILAPRQGTYDPNASAIGMRIQDRNGAPVSGVNVTAVGPSGTTSGYTGDDGCAVLPFLSPDTYSVTVSKFGYVDRAGTSAVTSSATTMAGQIFQARTDYDKAATVTTTFATTVGYDAPSGYSLPITVANSGITPNGFTAIPGVGTMRTLSNLWPYGGGYTMWAGGCDSNDPQSSGGTRTGPVVSAPGGVATALIPLGPVNVVGASPGSIVSAWQDVSTACTASATVNGVPVGALVALGTADASGALATSLPFGNWKIGDNSGLPSGGNSGNGNSGNGNSQKGAFVIPTTGVPVVAVVR